MRRIWILPAVLGVAATAGAGALLAASGPDGPPPQTQTQTPSPSPSHRLLPFEGPTPIELRFCSADEAIFVIESRVAYEDLPHNRALRELRAAQRIVAAQARWIRRRGEAELSRRVREWSRAFAQARMRVAAGADPLDALRPAIRRRNQIERILTCELDA